MKLLFVSQMTRYSRSVYTISKYVEVGRKLGHEVAVFGEQCAEFPSLPYSLDVKSFDFAIFVVHDPSDFPDLPYLAQLLDGVPRERRVLIDCCGRYNETIRVEHDFNHLEKMEGHQGWEWIEAFRAVAGLILQPALNPLPSDVKPFLFHGYDTAEVAHPDRSAEEAARSWAGSNGSGKPYGFVYVGNNWQRWSQMRPFLESIEPLKQELGPMCIAGWDWEQRPDWAVELGIQGSDVDPALLARLGVEVRPALPFDEVKELLGKARFSPIFHRPLFNHLGLVTNRTFQTFCADTIPVLMMPENMAQAIYGPAASVLRAGDGVAAHLREVCRQPEAYWSAVLKTREHLAQKHSFERRLEELRAILEG